MAMLFLGQQPQCLLPLLSILLTTSCANPIRSQSKRQYSDDEDVIEGASGESRGSVDLSKGGLIAIIVVASLVAIFGAISAILFYLAKKRQWAVRASIKRSARRAADSIKSPMTPRFPKTANTRTPTTRPQANGGKGQASRSAPPTKNSSQQKAHFSSRPEPKVTNSARDPEKGKETSSKATAKPDPKSDDTSSSPWWKRIFPTHRGGT